MTVKIMINRNLKDGSQAGRNAGGIGWNQTDYCRHPIINENSIYTLSESEEPDYSKYIMYGVLGLALLSILKSKSK